MDAIYGLIDTLLPFEWTEFDFMKNALLAVLLISPLFGLVGTAVVSNRMSFSPTLWDIPPSRALPSAC